MKSAPYVTAFFLSLQVIAAPAETPVLLQSGPTLEERDEQAYRSGEQAYRNGRNSNSNNNNNNNNGARNGGGIVAVAYQPAQVQGAAPAQTQPQVWGTAVAFGFGVKPGARLEGTAVHASFGGGLGPRPAAATPAPKPYQPGVAQPASAAPAPAPAPAPANPNSPGWFDWKETKAASLSATTNNQPIFCRRWPDTVASDGLGVRVFTGNTKIDLTCWTMASMEGSYGRVNQDGMWLKTSLGCYVNQAEISPRTKQNFQQQLNQCPTTSHWVGTLQTQYKREDCYLCPSLDCPSQNLGMGPFVDLECFSEGDVVNGNGTWYKQVEKACYYPNGVFAQQGFMGTKQEKCKAV